ncbi:hypothetical protein GGF46_001808 [Coemansia sp. RSA 552]|nr:hypothetical protein GGF46_001808 [Coemansia sp. RSA 552]
MVPQNTRRIPLPLGCVTCYFVRHGERIDHIDDNWVATTSVPYDPPLTSTGLKQAESTGALIYDAEDKMDHTPTEYTVLVSPFLRCAQTAEGIRRGFQSRQTAASAPWKVVVEPGLSEVMNENYFTGPLPESLITTRMSQMTGGSLCSNMEYDTGYVPVQRNLPVYPENFQDMMARFVSTLDHTTSMQIDKTSRQVASGLGATRKVAIFVTHGAGISSLLWATTLKPSAFDTPYCCMTRAQVMARTSSQPLQPFGSSRIPSYLWSVDYRAYAEHTRPNL